MGSQKVEHDWVTNIILDLPALFQRKLTWFKIEYKMAEIIVGKTWCKKEIGMGEYMKFFINMQEPVISEKH